MLPFENEGRTRWAHLPAAEPPVRLRAAVLAAWQREHGTSVGRAIGWFATAAVAALFVLAIALPARMQTPAAEDSTVAILRAQGVEVLAPPTATRPSEVRRVATGSAAARIGLRVGDRLLAIDDAVATGGMLNIAVLRGASPRYFALPGVRRVALDTGAGMAQAPARTRHAPRMGVGRATTTWVATSSRPVLG